MNEVKFFKSDKAPGLGTLIKDVRKSKMNKDKFKVDEIPNSNRLTKYLIARKLQILLFHSYISEAQYRSLKPVGNESPYKGGSPKIRKPGVPLKPILPMQSSLYHKLARWLVNILNPIRMVLTTHCIKESFELGSILENICLTSHKMFAVAVVSFSECASS